jgi:hypothetical protein
MLYEDVMTDQNESDEYIDNTPDPINYKNFRKYLKENGRERALGYLDAIKAMNENVESCFDHYDERFKTFTGSSPNRVRTKVKTFVSEVQFMINKIDQSKILVEPNDASKVINTEQPKI